MRQVTNRDPAWRFWSAVAAAVFGTLAILLWVSSAVADSTPHQVVVCKYVGTPGVDEVLQTGQNPIVVDTHALKGFTGTFPYAFADKQGQSIAIRYAANSHDGDISECPAPSGPPPCTEDCGPPPCTEDCGPPPCTEDCGPPPCTTDCGPPPCTQDCGPAVPPVVTHHHKHPHVPKAPTLKQYKQDVQQGAEPGGG